MDNDVYTSARWDTSVRALADVVMANRMSYWASVVQRTDRRSVVAVEQRQA